MRTNACLLLAVLLAPAAVDTQVAPPSPTGLVRDNQPQEKVRTARLSGRVLAADTGKPLRRAEVVVVPPGLPAGRQQREGRKVSTDADGRWELKELPAGRYQMTVSKGGYVTLQYGQQRPFEQGKLLEIADGQVLENLDVTLPRGSVITGRILDEFGDPVTNAFVTAMRYRYVEGQRVLTPLSEGLAGLLNGGSITDDTGQYRLHGLAPGSYYVSALFDTVSPGASDDRTRYAPTFYPGTASASEAQRVTLGIGQEAQNISFNLTMVPVARVSGSVVSSSGQPIRASVDLIPLVRAAGNLGASATANADGTFTISNVFPDEYRLYVSYRTAAGVTAPELAAISIVVTGLDMTGVAIVTAPAAMATGRVVFDGAPQAGVPQTPMTIHAAPANAGMQAYMSSGTARAADEWRFEVRGLLGHHRFRIPYPPEGWFLKSVTLDGTDITDSGYEFKPGQTVSGIEIVLTQRATALSGVVQDDRGRPIVDYAVVAFSTDRTKWGYQTRLVRSSRPDQGGTFVLRGLPPGDYLVVALEYLEPGDETDPDQLERWKPYGARVTLAEGEAQSITLKLTR